MIRDYTDQDTDALIDIWWEANALAHPFLPEAFVAQGTYDMRHTYLPNAETFVIEQAGTPVGFISMIGSEIGGLFIRPDHHGRGLGRALVEHVAALKGPLTVEVFAENAIGLPFYERMGFRKTGEYLHEPSGAVTLQMALPGG